MTDDAPDDDSPRIHIHMRLRRTMGFLPPMGVKAWLWLKSLVMLAALAVAVVHLMTPAVVTSETLRWVVGLIVVWFVYDQLANRYQYGTSHIIVATNGVFFTEDNIHLRWEDIESYSAEPTLLRLKPRPAALPGGLFVRRRYEIPITDRTREPLLEAFQDNAVTPLK